jgi:hypothetical protein
LRVNWSSSRISASGSVDQAAGRAPASAASISAPKRARISASKASLLTNHSRRWASGGAPNQKASASSGAAAISSPP